MPRPLLPPTRVGRAYLQNACRISRNTFFGPEWLGNPERMRALDHRVQRLGEKNAMHHFDQTAVDRMAKQLAKDVREGAAVDSSSVADMASRTRHDCGNAECGRSIPRVHRYCPHCGQRQRS